MRGRSNKHRNNVNAGGTRPAAPSERHDSAAAEVTGATVQPVTQRSISSIILRDWKRVALITAAVTAIAWMLASMQPSRYRAHTLAAVAPLAGALQTTDYLRGLEVLERRTVVTTIAALASTAQTRARAGAAPGYEIAATVVANTNLFRVEVEGADAARTAAVANRVTQLLSAQTTAIYKYYGVTTIAAAVPPSEPFEARSPRVIAAGAIVGLLLGFLASYASHRRSPLRGSRT